MIREYFTSKLGAVLDGNSFATPDPGVRVYRADMHLAADG